ncbi:MAG: hypothetical protein DWI00_06400 [Planctomycetota bacterium]|nr:MAG: hypothetical protein DWI00_06400 [Planctomycetota bacterium]
MGTDESAGKHFHLAESRVLYAIQFKLSATPVQTCQQVAASREVQVGRTHTNTFSARSSCRDPRPDTFG